VKFREIELLGDWKPPELETLRKILQPLPRAWVESNPSLRTIGRESVLRDAPPEAPGHSKYEPQLGAIVVYDKGVYHDGKLDSEQFHRSVYHELAHSIIRSNPGLLKTWHASTRGDGFVDEYAKTSPEEDFADTFSEYFIHNGAARKAVPKKAAFLQELLSQAQEKIAMDFMNAFTDELCKTAGAKDQGLQKILAAASRFGKSGLGKGTMGAVGGGGVAGSVAYKQGDETGFKQGTKGARRYGEQQRMMGRREGGMAMYNYIRKRTQGQQR
jgi:hypothetical protein